MYIYIAFTYNVNLNNRNDEYILYISLFEHRQFLESLEIPYSQKKLNLVFKKMDLNFDGEVCYLSF